MFETVLRGISGIDRLLDDRSEGIELLRAAKDLYHCSEVGYLGLNIPGRHHGEEYAHCFYSDGDVKYVMTSQAVETDFANPTGGLAFGEHDDLPDDDGRRTITFTLCSTHQETAYFGIAYNEHENVWAVRGGAVRREIEILGQYFHNHILRLNGGTAPRTCGITAREVACLRWTAEGKTAWEASVILGISERTVRFHLNAVREKMDCATTTQAVAQAVARRIINV